jgi:caffeoyl-CoA O-methyltransferase
VDVVFPQITDYLHALTPERDSILKEMEALGARDDFPIVGPLVGRFLYQMAVITRAQRIFEMGSGFGYSAYWFATAMPQGGQVICTDTSEERLRLARSFFSRAGLEERIVCKVGNALDILRTEPGPFDLIFNDVDKEDYPQAFKLAMDKLRPGGLLITDNVLWSGEILSDDLGGEARAILVFNQLIYRTEGVYSTIVPLRDGLSISLKL